MRVFSVFKNYCSSKDDSLFAAMSLILKSEQEGLFIGLTTDIEPRIFHSEYHRSSEFRGSNMYPTIIFSTYIFRRIATRLKLRAINLMADFLGMTVGFLTVDGFSNICLKSVPNRSCFIVFWCNDEMEANEFWQRQKILISSKKRTEFFPRTDYTALHLSENSERQYSRFNFLKPTELMDHFPSIPRILFASDINVELRPTLCEYQRRLTKYFGRVIDFDGFLWQEARLRVHTFSINSPYEIEGLKRYFAGSGNNAATATPTKSELNAIRLTLHGRERYLFIKAFSESDLSDSLVLIGKSWAQFPSLRKHLSGLRRFPSSLEVQFLQRSRVCPILAALLVQVPVTFEQIFLRVARSVSLSDEVFLRIDF